MMHLKTDLLPWQWKAVDKLRHLKVGALYMDMGTGKTRTALELLKLRLRDGKVLRALWLCPYGIQANLKADLDKHTDGWQDVIKVCGIETLSSSISANIDCRNYVGDGMTYLIVDESSLVKNHKALRSQRIEYLAQKCAYKLILNGTPISKNEKDLYQQWAILDRRILGYQSFLSFAANHLEYDDRGRICKCLNTDVLTKKIAPYTYQVTREECMTLPDKRYHSSPFYLPEARLDEYTATMDEFLDLFDEGKPTTLYRLFTALQAVTSGRTITTEPEVTPLQSRPAYPTPEDNPRIQELIQIVESDIHDQKCIIFARLTYELEDIADVLTRRGYTTAMYTGDLTRKKRDASLAAFAGDTQFLLANKACGAFGLNLQFAHCIIYYSNDWDYATRIQSEDRVHRLGQEHEVDIWDIYAVDTIDERIMRCLRRKEGLLDDLREQIKGIQGESTRGKLRDLLMGGM